MALIGSSSLTIKSRPLGRNYFRISYGLKSDGSGIGADSAEVETDRVARGDRYCDPPAPQEIPAMGSIGEVRRSDSLLR